MRFKEDMEMRKTRMNLVWVLAGIGCILSCFPITINVYFPEAKLESAASQIESTVRGGGGPEEGGSSWALPRIHLAFGPREAYAQDAPDLKVQTPAITAIVKRRTERFSKIDALLTKGFVGEGKDGLLKEKDGSVLDLKELAQSRKLVKEENADRQDLYKEIARENKIPDDQVSRIAEIFGKENRKQIKVGQYYEDDNGNWKKKEAGE